MDTLLCCCPYDFRNFLKNRFKSVRGAEPAASNSNNTNNDGSTSEVNASPDPDQDYDKNTSKDQAAVQASNRDPNKNTTNENNTDQNTTQPDGGDMVQVFFPTDESSEIGPLLIAPAPRPLGEPIIVDQNDQRNNQHRSRHQNIEDNNSDRHRDQDTEDPDTRRRHRNAKITYRSIDS